MTTRRNQFRFSRVDTSAKRFNYAASRQGSSAVEQGTHKPLVGSSILPPGIGSAVDLNSRFAQHLRSHPATTKRLGDSLEIVAKKEVPTLAEAQEIQRSLKRKKNLKLAIYHLKR